MNIIDFTIENFKSYREETTFTFEALDSDFRDENLFTARLEDGSELRLLKSAALYGANAAGKSNIIWALKALSYFVKNSREFPVDYLIPFEPYRWDHNGDDTRLALRFVTRGEIYRYTVSYNSRAFTSEELNRIEKGREVSIFRKVPGRVSIGEGWRSTSLDLSNIEFLPNHLLLSEMAVREKNDLQHIYLAMAGMTVEPLLNVINIHDRNVRVSREILSGHESELFGRLQALMRISDLGIVGLEMKAHGDDEFQFPDSVPTEIRRQIIDNNRWEFNTFHKDCDDRDVKMPLEQESTGTQNLFSLGAMVLDVLGRGGFLAYDEMDVAVHPQLFRLLIRLFHSPQSNPHNAQILFTTHNTIIVNETDGIMRADQIWFAEKDSSGRSSLYSAQDFEEISISVPFERWYRMGRFGGTPNFGDVSEIMGAGR